MRAKKRFGQNFLVDQIVLDTLNKIICAQDGDILLEIGPGKGALTERLLATGAHVIGVELDQDLIPVLNNRFDTQDNFTLYSMDALQLNISQFAEQYGKKIRVVGNLPYNISTHLLGVFVRHIEVIQSIDIMLQKEVAYRLAATASGKNRGRLSVIIQYWFEIDITLDIAPESFDPPPKVDSCFVSLQPKQSPEPVKDFEIFETILAKGFSTRRKSLHNSLKLLMTEESIAQCGINPKLRAEQLTLEQWLELANYDR